MDSQVKTSLNERQKRPIWVHTHVGGILDQFRRTLQPPLSESFRVPLRWPHWSIDDSWLMWSCFPLLASNVWSASHRLRLVFIILGRLGVGSSGGGHLSAIVFGTICACGSSRVCGMGLGINLYLSHVHFLY